MSHWLTFATQLIRHKKPEQLTYQFVELLKQELRLSDCLLLFPNNEGRLLLPHDGRNDLQWLVTDLNNPFSQVLQSSETLILTPEDLLFWQSDRCFTQVVGNVRMFESVLIQPLPINEKHIQSILVVIGDSQQVEQVSNDQGFIQFLDLFMTHWALLDEMGREVRSKNVLKESLSDIEQQSHYKELSECIEDTLIGKSAAMQKLRNQIARAATSKLSVMVQGETGTGKELVAQAIHRLSSRNKQPFIAINCAAIPENLLESELFGYEKGAFSGADGNKQGLLAQADGGTLFLDEIGDMPLALQAKLLRVLETKLYRPLGGKCEKSSNFRLVSATHVNLLGQVREKRFRQDLYYRLFQYPITLPRLCERKEDISLLSEHFVIEFNHQNNRNVRGVDYRALDCLQQHSFPGNIRELKHLIEYGCAQTTNGMQVSEHCFSQRISALCEVDLIHDEQPEKSQEDNKTISGQIIPRIDDLKQAMSDYEASIIRQRLLHFSGNRTKAAKSLGIPKRTLAYKCQKLEIKIA